MKLRFVVGAVLFALSSICWLGAAARTASAAPQSRNMSEEDLKYLTVMIDATLRGAPSRGAGIICGVDKDSLYVVTADHVVRSGTDEPQELQLQFKQLPGTRVKAMLLPQHDTELDLAVLRVDRLNELKINVESLPFDRLGSPGSLKRGDEIYMLGYPGGKKWWINTTPERFAESEGDWIRFESRLITGGNSGGALLDKNRDLVGMVRSDEPPDGEAVSITSVMRRLRDWGYPIGLGELNSSPINFSLVSAGTFSVCGITTSGTAYCWGRIGTSSIHDKSDAEDGKKHLSIFSDRPVRVKGGLVFKAISVGFQHACGVTTGGIAYCWGNNILGMLGDGSKERSLDPSPVSGDLAFQSISAGTYATCGLNTGGKAYCWGDHDLEPKLMQGGTGFRSVNADNPMYGVSVTGVASLLNPNGPAAPIKDIVFDRESGGCGITTSGAAYCWNPSSHGFVEVPAPEGVFFQSISADTDRWCAIEKSGIIRCAERPFREKEFKSTVVRAPGGRAFRSVSVGYTLACGITVDSALYCWGILLNYEWIGRTRGVHKDYGAVPVLITRR